MTNPSTSSARPARLLQTDEDWRQELRKKYRFRPRKRREMLERLEKVVAYLENSRLERQRERRRERERERDAARAASGERRAE